MIPTKKNWQYLVAAYFLMIAWAAFCLWKLPDYIDAQAYKYAEDNQDKERLLRQEHMMIQRPTPSRRYRHHEV